MVDPNVVCAQRAIQTQQRVEIDVLEVLVDRMIDDDGLLSVNFFKDKGFCDAFRHYKLLIKFIISAQFPKWSLGFLPYQKLSIDVLFVSVRFSRLLSYSFQ